MTQPGPIIVGWLLVFGVALQASARQPAVATLEDVPVAFVDVDLIRMDRERVERGQTVLTRGDRIAAIGPRSAVTVPDDAIVIQGAGRYLTPGLTDAHVHLEGDGTAFGGRSRPDFGDAPLYLAYGVTTVLNLRGTPEHLDWRRQIETGELVGPTIYTSGRFVNEPRVNSPDEVREEITAQARDGYDLIKFHEIGPRVDPPGTTLGLSLPTYRAMNETAREVGLPLLGHAPVNLGLDALFQARQSLAHVGMLTNIHFLPAVFNFEFFVVTGVALLTLMVVVIAWGVAAVVARRGREGARHPAVSRLRALTGWVLAGSLVAAGCAALFLPGGPLFDSLALRLAFTALAVLICAATMALLVVAIGVWRGSSAFRFARQQALLASLAGLGLVYAALMFWIPVAWRSSDAGIERLAERVGDVGIWIQTSMLPYDAIGGPGRPMLVDDPAIGYLQAEIRARWLRIPQGVPSWYRYTDFTKKVVFALHRAGVPLMAGTDAMGFPLIPPGTSLHRELQLIVESGLTPYEALRAATVVPASFLGKEGEFGAIAVGKRADFLLVEDNPLENIGHLRTLVGVMARGMWYSRSELERMLDALRPGIPPSSVSGPTP